MTLPSGGFEDAPARVSDQLAALGPFFAAATHDPHATADAPWREMRELLDDPGVLAGRVHTARAYLAAGTGQEPGAVELRVAASVTHLGLAARILSPLLALAVLHGRTKPISLRDLRWQPTVPSTFPLSIAGLGELAAHRTADLQPAILADALAEGIVRTIAADLCAAGRPFAVSERVLWGNIASALNGACSALSTARPDLAPVIHGVAAHLLAHPVLADTSQTSLDGRFQRRSCCLIYRAAPNRDGMVCGDCVLLGRQRTPQARSREYDT